MPEFQPANGRGARLGTRPARAPVAQRNLHTRMKQRLPTHGRARGTAAAGMRSRRRPTSRVVARLARPYFYGQPGRRVAPDAGVEGEAAARRTRDLRRAAAIAETFASAACADDAEPAGDKNTTLVGKSSGAYTWRICLNYRRQTYWTGAYGAKIVYQNVLNALEKAKETTLLCFLYIWHPEVWRRPQQVRGIDAAAGCWKPD